MLRFDVYRNGELAKDVDLAGAYVFGQDAIPVRAELAAAEGQITCIKRSSPGATGLTLCWDVGSTGRLLVSTTRLPDRGQPYNLNLELARAQMARLAQKREEWGLFDYADAQAINREFDEIRDQFIAALMASDPAEAAAKADQALAEGVTLGEKMALFHAEVLMGRRKLTTNNRPLFGCRVNLETAGQEVQGRLRESFDAVTIPAPWRHVEPKSHQFDFAQIESWVQWAVQSRKRITMGPLLSFEPGQMPDWMYIWEHDYDTLREMISEHIETVVRKFKGPVAVWNVLSGIHAHNSFNLSFDQLMELTRMCCLQVKRLNPQAQVIIELTTPWGEYYARNQRTIPPLLYADMAVQSGIRFDGFGVQVFMGVPVDGHYVRDLLHISCLLDEFASQGKSVHISACQVPSDVNPDADDAWNGAEPIAQAGQWHANWSQRLQAEWLQAFSRVCISKPFVESITWRDLADDQGHFIPHGGLCAKDLTPKLAYKELRNFRALLASKTVSPGGAAGQSNRSE
jgi:GH35 family endo-1,4-beta-xylanase